MPCELNITLLPLREQTKFRSRDFVVRQKNIRRLRHPLKREKGKKLFRNHRAAVFCDVIVGHCAVLFGDFIVGIPITVDVPFHHFPV